MSIGNLIRKNDKFDKEYTAEVLSNADTLRRGRLQVKISTLMGDVPFWVNSTLVTGSVSFLVIPDAGDKVNVKFRNKDIYSGEWSLKGDPSNSANIDPNKYGFKDANGNVIIVDKSTNAITIESKATVTIKGTSIILDGNTQIKGNLDVTGKVTANDAEIAAGANLTKSQTVTSVKGIVKGS